MTAELPPERVQAAITQLRPYYPKKSAVELVAFSPTLTQYVKDWLGQHGWEHNQAFLKSWRWNGRPQQFAPLEPDWDIWLILAGRGFGKTRTGAEWVRYMILSGLAKRVALIGRTAADVRDVMIFGPSGIMDCCTDWERPTWEPSKRQLTWYNEKGEEIAICKCYSADNPEQLRGPQHDAAWADEICAWKYADAWDQLQLGLRLGEKPRCVVTTTPRSITLLKKLLHRAKNPNEKGEFKVRVTHGDTRDNRQNLAASYIEAMEEQYRGTRLGRQELEGVMLEDLKGPLWSLSMLEKLRREPLSDPDHKHEWGMLDADGNRTFTPKVKILRTVIGVDPSVTDNPDSDEYGIVAAGLGTNDEAYVLGDYSGKYSPQAYALEVLNAYDTHQADAIVIETNRGGEHVVAVIHLTCEKLKRPVPRILDLNSQEGKVGRAEPVVALYEQGRVHHLGSFRELEDEMVTWDPAMQKRSPNRVDALVFAVAELIPYKPAAPPVGKRVQAQEGHFNKPMRAKDDEQPRRRRRLAERKRHGRSFEDDLGTQTPAASTWANRRSRNEEARCFAQEEKTGQTAAQVSPGQPAGYAVAPHQQPRPGRSPQPRFYAVTGGRPEQRGVCGYFAPGERGLLAA